MIAERGSSCGSGTGIAATGAATGADGTGEEGGTESAWGRTPVPSTAGTGGGDPAGEPDRIGERDGDDASTGSICTGDTISGPGVMGIMASTPSSNETRKVP